MRAALQQPTRWWLLGLSDDQARLWSVEHGTPAERELPLERPSRAAANAERVQPVQGGASHAHRRRGGGGQLKLSPQRFGDEQTDDIERAVWYDVVVAELRGAGSPQDLVLVANGLHHAGFTRACARLPLAVHAIDHNPAEPSVGQLRDLGAERLRRPTEEELEKLRGAWHSASATTESLSEALVAAKAGRIDTLLWAPGTAPRPGSEVDAAPAELSDVVDEIVRQTVLHGGRTVPLWSEPSVPVRAILRW